MEAKNKLKMAKNNTEIDPLRALHKCNDDIYNIVDRLKEINVDVGLAYQYLRDATKAIHQGIANMINKPKEN